jgi:hypothetical protein
MEVFIADSQMQSACVLVLKMQYKVCRIDKQPIWIVVTGICNDRFFTFERVFPILKRADLFIHNSASVGDRIVCFFSFTTVAKELLFVNEWLKLNYYHYYYYWFSVFLFDVSDSKLPPNTMLVDRVRSCANIFGNWRLVVLRLIDFIAFC